MDLRCLLLAVTLVSGLGYAETDANTYAIDTFDNAQSLRAWHVSGPGSLKLGPGYRGSGAVLTYRVEHDAPLIVGWSPTRPVPKVQNPTVSLWVRFSDVVEIALQVEDTGGSKLILPLEASLERSRPGKWQYAVAQLKKRVAALALIIRSRTGGSVQGEFDYDEVMLNKGDDVFSAPSEERTDAPLSDTTDLALLGVNIHLLRDEHSLDLARAAGFRFVRMDLLWKNVERRGRFRFFTYDFLLRELEARGMGVLWILDYGHPDHGGDVPRSAEDVAAFSRFAEATATHYGGRNVRYEIWNEPNNPQFWAPSPNPAEYAVLLREAATAIRRADPSAIVSSGGVSNLDLSYISRSMDRSLAPMLKAISVHPYTRDKPETIVPAYVALRRWVAKELGESVEIWDSEWGYSSALSGSKSAQNGHSDRDRQRQANLAVREILCVWALGFSLGVWYDLRDDGQDAVNPEQNYGLLDSDGREKPAMRAVRNLMNSAIQRKFTGMIAKVPPGLHAMRFDGANDQLLIVWTEIPDKRKTLECNRNDFISATDMMGGAIKTKSQTRDRLRIRIAESAGPVYLLLKAGSRR